MSLVKKLQECSSMSDVDTVLSGYRGVRPTFRKTLETAIMLKNNPDQQQRDVGQGFWNIAIKEAFDMEKSEQPATPHDDGIKSRGNKFVKEEELSNHNPSQQNAGSEQSSDNTEPYPQEGTDEEVTDMKDATGENQMKEGFGGMPPQGGQGGMPQPQGMGQPMGMDPSIANEMGMGQQIPQMNTPQMMRQMQYTINETLKRYILPMRNTIRIQQEAIKKLSTQIQEIEGGKSSMKLDIPALRDNATARTMPTRETIISTPQGQITTTPSKMQETENARFDIAHLDRMFREKNSGLK